MNRLPRLAIAAYLLALSAGVAAPACLADDSSVKLEGRGSRREALDAMSYKPFDAAWLSKMEGWTGPGTLDAAAIKGKPVLIVAWASWFKSSHDRGLKLVQPLIDANPDLTVIALHHARGFDKASETAKALGFKGPIAHDAKGELFTALKVDGAGPNFYIIDRAGNLRFADVSAASLDAAVQTVTKETAEEAAKAQPPAKADPKKPPQATGKPSADAYANAKWPAHNKGGRDLSAKNVQGKPLPVAFGKETWITPKVALENKVIVLDFWAIWCGPCRAASPILDDVQKKHEGKVVVIGVSGQAMPPRYPEDVAAIKKYLEKSKSEYSHVNDVENQRVYKSLDIEGIPHVVVMSTDGVVRWQGNPHDPNFKKAVDAVVKVDPGLGTSGKSGGAEASDAEKPKP
jgi:thiol-disulfide isomerase/thioredoxin